MQENHEKTDSFIPHIFYTSPSSNFCCLKIKSPVSRISVTCCSRHLHWSILERGVGRSHYVGQSPPGVRRRVPHWGG